LDAMIAKPTDGSAVAQGLATRHGHKAPGCGAWIFGEVDVEAGDEDGRST